MLDLLWTLRGSVPLDRTTEAEAFQRVERLLVRQHKRVICSSDDHLDFRVPLFSAANWTTPSWKAMIIYDHGEFQIERTFGDSRLCYSLSSLKILMFCLSASVVFLIIGSLGDGLLGGFKVAIAAVTWVYGGNLVLAWARVPLLIRKAVLKS